MIAYPFTYAPLERISQGNFSNASIANMREKSYAIQSVSVQTSQGREPLFLGTSHITQAAIHANHGIICIPNDEVQAFAATCDVCWWDDHNDGLSQPYILAAMCRKRIIGFLVATFVLVMAGALVYEAFDIHDPKPFFIDPEFLLMMLSSMLIFCVGIPALIRRLFSFCLSLSERLPLGIVGLSRCSSSQHEKFEIERLLFSPPLSVTSLRI